MSEDKVVLKIRGMTCSGCAATVKNILEKEGARDIYVDFSMNEAVFSKPDKLPVERFIRAIEKGGYKVMDEEVKHDLLIDRKLILYVLISAFLTIPLLLGMFADWSLLHRPEFQWILSTPVMVIGILQFGRSTIHALIRRKPNMDMLVLTGSLAAYFYSVAGWLMFRSHDYIFFETSSAIITFILLGLIIEQYSVSRTTREIRKLQKNTEIRFATKKVQKGEHMDYQTVEVDKILSGDILLVREGEKVPLDGLIVSGSGELDESLITGESIPVFKKENEEILAGSVLVRGSVEVQVIRTGSATLLAQIVEMVRKAQRDKTDMERLGDRISSVFVPLVFLIALLTFIIHFFFGHLTEGLMRSIAVLVIACPCAMGLAAPTAITVALGVAAKHRVLIRAASAFERLHQSNIFVFDKTGTLTTGKFEVNEFQLFSSTFTKEMVLSILYSAEIRSQHPVAKSLCTYAERHHARLLSLEDFHEEKGMGLRFSVNHQGLILPCRIGSLRMVNQIPSSGSKDYDVYVWIKDECVAGLKLKDELRENVPEVFDFLKRQGKKIFLLSGDRREKCLRIAENLNIPEEHIFSEQLPAQKMDIIHRLRREGKVCMVGDGINDAPALAQADVAVSFNHSSSIAMDAADIVIAHPLGFQKLKTLILLSSLTLKKIRQNYFWAFFYNVLAIPLAFLGLLKPIVASLSMAFSDVIVVGNSLSIFRFGKNS